ncbi:uncharacterized protein [Nicotiana tomentosiformis]|uniref:uncharacterized protein n=1 Tax=Nicotiana tomentosiformis TaxID=4098 RepID=UPI00388CB6C6
MFGTFAQARFIPVAPTTSQTEGGTQTPAAHTPKQRVHAGKVPGVMVIQPVVPIQPVVRTATSKGKHLRLARFKKYDPPTFSGLASESAQYFLDECHRILRTMGIVEMSGVALTTFQLKGAAYQWWRAYELGSLADVASLTWVQFSEMFLGEFVPQSLRDAWRAEFERLHKGSMSVSEYAVRFSDLAKHAPALVSTDRERVHRFIEGLRHDIRFSMSWELESDVSF